MPEEPNELSDGKPQASQGVDATVVASPKKQQPKKVWLVAAILLLFIVTGVAATYFFVSQSQKTDKKSDTSLDAATKFASAKTLVTDVKSELSGTSVEIASTDGLGGKTATGYGAYGVPAYQVGDRKYKNLPATSIGSAYKGDSATASKNYKKLTDFFSKNKFKQLTTGSNQAGPIAWTRDSVTYVSYATYESNDMLCMIWHADASGTPLAGHVTSIGCGDKSSYEVAAKALDTYYAAYTKDETDPSKQIVLGSPRSGDNSGGGYKVAVVYQEDASQLDTQFEGLYYKTNDQTEWTYFTGSYGWLDCTSFNTDVLKKAFNGFNCYDKASDKIINVGTATSAPELKG